MASETFYPDAEPATSVSDGSTVHEDTTTFTLLRAGAGTSATDSATDSNYFFLRATAVLDVYDRIDRGIFLFDVSGFTGNVDAITGITLDFYPTEKNDDFGGQSMSLVTSAPAANTAVVAGDFDSLATTKQATDLTISSITINQYNSFTLNSTGVQTVKDVINGAGIVKFGTRLTADNDNSAPTWTSGGTVFVNGGMADNATQGRRPRLVITYASATSNFLIF